MASATASKKPVTGARFSSGKRVKAKPNAAVKIIKGRMASLAAAAIGFVGIMARKKSPKGGTGPGFSVMLKAARKASADPSGIGKTPRMTGIMMAAMMDEHHKITSIVPTPRAASLPARAAKAVCAIPVIKRATTSGTTVIRNAFNQTEPIVSAVALIASLAPSQIPAKSPKMSAARMMSAFDMSQYFQPNRPTNWPRAANLAELCWHCKQGTRQNPGIPLQGHSRVRAESRLITS